MWHNMRLMPPPGTRVVRLAAPAAQAVVTHAGWWAALLLAVAAAGCGTTEAASVRLAFWSSRPVTATPMAPALPEAGPAKADVEASARLVERAMRRRGLRFGTSGGVGPLYAFFEHRERITPATTARVGDVVFLRTTADAPSCRDQVGLVESIDGNGRITFRHVSGGKPTRAYFHPRRPTERRDETGRVLNSFLRPVRPGDPANALYYAGQMVCAVGRVPDHDR